MEKLKGKRKKERKKVIEDETDRAQNKSREAGPV